MAVSFSLCLRRSSPAVLGQLAVSAGEQPAAPPVSGYISGFSPQFLQRKNERGFNALFFISIDFFSLAGSWVGHIDSSRESGAFS